MSEELTFTRFCGMLVFGDGTGAWDSLTGDQRERFCAQARKDGLELLFMYVLKQRLPGAFFPRFRLRYQEESMKKLLEGRELADFYRLLETEKIPFVPIKGTDLAFRIYPDPAIRPYNDWDILFREEDCPRALKLIQANGWRTYSGYAPRMECHHYEAMCHDGYCLEAHRILPCFGTAAAEEIWRETEAVTDRHRVLVPEMNLLLITSHASEYFYAHVPKWKLLLDAGMILKHCAVDWKKVHQLADRWGILHPDILLHVWSDFFPESVLPPEDPASERQRLIREIIDVRQCILKYSDYDKQLACTHDFRWLRDRLGFYNPASICLKYHLQKRQRGKILLYGVRDLLAKILYWLRHSRKKDPELQSHIQKIAKLEQLVKHGK